MADDYRCAAKSSHAYNGHPPRQGGTYCMRCAVLLHDVGYFTATDGTVLPSAEQFQAALAAPSKTDGV